MKGKDMDKTKDIHLTFEQLGFKAGDRVRCVDSDGLGWYTEGQEYDLVKSPHSGRTCIKVGIGYVYDTSASFELVTPEIKTLYEVNGKQYDTREEAEASLGPVVKDVKYIGVFPNAGRFSAKTERSYERLIDYKACTFDRIDRIELLSDGSTRIVQDVKE